MAHYMLFYATADDFIERRKPYRADHLDHVKRAHKKGHLIMGGAFTDPPDEAALVFKVDDKQIVAAFAETDPYVKHGLVNAWKIREWKVVIGDVE